MIEFIFSYFCTLKLSGGFMKSYWDRFVIPFKGLKEGKHEFVYDIDKAFFDQLDYSILEDGEVKVEMEMEKQPTMLVFHFEIHGYIKLKCDRCLEEYRQPVDGHRVLIVKFSAREDDNSNDDIVTLPEDAHEYDVGHQVYEYINLLLPIKHVHQNEDECNQEMIEKLNEENKSNAPGEIDERWKALEELKKNMKNN